LTDVNRNKEYDINKIKNLAELRKLGSNLMIYICELCQIK